MGDGGTFGKRVPVKGGRIAVGKDDADTWEKWLAHIKKKGERRS